MPSSPLTTLKQDFIESKDYYLRLLPAGVDENLSDSSYNLPEEPAVPVAPSGIPTKRRLFFEPASIAELVKQGGPTPDPGGFPAPTLPKELVSNMLKAISTESPYKPNTRSAIKRGRPDIQVPISPFKHPLQLDKTLPR